MKKKIIRTAEDYKEKLDYNRKAETCPECGKYVWTQLTARGVFKNTYTCANCGCRWKARRRRM